MGRTVHNNIPLKTPETFDILQGKIDVRQTRNTTSLKSAFTAMRRRRRNRRKSGRDRQSNPDVYRDTRLGV